MSNFLMAAALEALTYEARQFTAATTIQQAKLTKRPTRLAFTKIR